MVPEDERGNNDRLDGWGAIAQYLRHDIRTVQRWEKAEGLPVHRHAGAKARVWASRLELNSWWQGRETAPAGVTEDTPQLENAKSQPEVPHQSEAYDPRAVLSRIASLRPWLKPPAIATAVFCVVLTASVVIWRQRLNHIEVPTDWVPDRIFAAAALHPPAKIHVGGNPGMMLLTPDSRELYVLNHSPVAYINVINLDQMRVARQLNCDGGPRNMIFDPTGRKLYVSTEKRGLYIYDRRTETVKIVHESLSGLMTGLAVTPDGSRVYIALGRGGLRRYDLKSGKVTSIPGLVCPDFLTIDPAGRRLYVSCKCGGTPGVPAHDTIAVVDLATEKSVAEWKGGPMVAGPLYLFPSGDHLWVDGQDACNNPHYLKYDLSGCPYFPGHIQHIFRVADGVNVKTLGSATDEPMGDPRFTPDGLRVILAGKPIQVLDTMLFQEQERYSDAGEQLSSPILDRVRHKLYISGHSSGDVYAFDLPSRDCDPPAAGLGHFWAGDGSRNDRVGTIPITFEGGPAYGPGRIGAAFRLDRTSLEVRTPYSTMDGVTFRNGSIAGWFRVDSAANQELMQFYEADDRLWRVATDADSHLVLQWLTEAATSGSTLAANTWHHIAVMRSADAVTVYLDGGLEIRTPVAPAPCRNLPRVLRLGPMAGMVDELATYFRALSGDELRAIVNLPRVCLANNDK
jgi:hypothetical protein